MKELGAVAVVTSWLNSVEVDWTICTVGSTDEAVLVFCVNSCCAFQVIGRIMSRKEALSQFIQQIHGRPVVVKLNSGVDYRGKTDFLGY